MYVMLYTVTMQDFHEFVFTKYYKHIVNCSSMQSLGEKIKY